MAPKPSNHEPKVPAVVEIEQALLGTLILGPELIGRAAVRLSDGEMFSHACRTVYRALVAMNAAHEPIDLHLLWNRLGDDGPKIGGVAWLSSLTDGAVRDETFVDRYIELIRESAAKRDAVSFSERLKQDASNGSAIADLQSGMAEEIRRLGEYLPQGEMTPMGNEVNELLTAVNRAHAGEIVSTGILTGIDRFDSLTGGMASGNMIVVAARPSLGKSSLCTQIMLHLARNSVPSCLLSLEMTNTSVVFRIACQIARVSLHKARGGFLGEEEQARLRLGLDEIRDLPLYINDTAMCDISKMQSMVEQTVARNGCKLAVVDYIQLVRSQGENRTQEVSKVSAACQGLARWIGKTTGGALIAVSQLSRAVGNDDPQLHHLRESGSIEQDADVVLFIHNPKRDDDDDRSAEFRLAKQRNGPLGGWPMVWLKECFRFENVAPEY